MIRYFLLLLGLCWSVQADPNILVHLTFENDFTSSLRVDDQSGYNNHGYIPAHAPFTFSGTYSPLRVPGKTGIRAMQQTNFGTVEYAAIVTAGGGDTNHFPGYVIESYVAIPFTNGPLHYLTNFTIGFWIKLAQTEAENTGMTLVTGGWTDTVNSWVIGNAFNEGTGQIGFTQITNAATNPQRSVVTFGGVPAGAWIHLCVTGDAGANQVRSYTNGILCQTGTMAAPFYVTATQGSATYILLMANGHGDSWQVDPEQNDVSPNNGWVGDGSVMDDFRIYNRTLAPNEVLAMATPGPAMTVGTGLVKAGEFK